MADLAKIVEDLSNLTVLEAAELSKLLEEHWGVSAAAPVAVAAAGAAGGGEAAVDGDNGLTGGLVASIGRDARVLAFRHGKGPPVSRIR